MDPMHTSLVALISPRHSFSTDTRSPRTLHNSADAVDTSRHRQRCNASPSSESSWALAPPADLSFPMAVGKLDTQLYGRRNVKGTTKGFFACHRSQRTAWYRAPGTRVVGGEEKVLHGEKLWGISKS